MQHQQPVPEDALADPAARGLPAGRFAFDLVETHAGVALLETYQGVFVSSTYHAVATDETDRTPQARAGERLHERLPHRRPLVLEHDVHEVPAEQLGAGLAQHLLERAVDRREVALFVHARNGVLGRIHQARVPRLRGDERRRLAALFGDIARDREHAHHHARASHGRERHRDEPALPVGAHEMQLEPPQVAGHRRLELPLDLRRFHGLKERHVVPPEDRIAPMPGKRLHGRVDGGEQAPGVERDDGIGRGLHQVAVPGIRRGRLVPGHRLVRDVTQGNHEVRHAALVEQRRHAHRHLAALVAASHRAVEPRGLAPPRPRDRLGPHGRFARGQQAAEPHAGQRLRVAEEPDGRGVRELQLALGGRDEDRVGGVLHHQAMPLGERVIVADVIHRHHRAAGRMRRRHELQHLPVPGRAHLGARDLAQQDRLANDALFGEFARLVQDGIVEVAAARAVVVGQAGHRQKARIRPHHPCVGVEHHDPVADGLKRRGHLLLRLGRLLIKPRAGDGHRHLRGELLQHPRVLAIERPFAVNHTENAHGPVRREQRRHHGVPDVRQATRRRVRVRIGLGVVDDDRPSLARRAARHRRIDRNEHSLQRARASLGRDNLQEILAQEGDVRPITCKERHGVAQREPEHLVRPVGRAQRARQRGQRIALPPLALALRV